jgi:hypothetical protein
MAERFSGKTAADPDKLHILPAFSDLGGERELHFVSANRASKT